MPLYVCNYCDYLDKHKGNYYYHLYRHINNNKSSFDPEEIELCNYYYYYKNNVRTNYLKNNKDRIKKYKAEYDKNNKKQQAEYYQNNKDKIKQKKAEYYQNNKDKIKQNYYKKKLEKVESSIINIIDDE